MEQVNKIPKIVHYCWFGGKKPLLVKKCINSWKEFLPDYEIKEWNESNFDINSNEFTKRMYMEKRWAFVADYVRFYVMHKYGGIYLDTDMEVLKSFNNLLKYPVFFGFETKSSNLQRPFPVITAGIFGCVKGNRIIRECVKKYDFQTTSYIRTSPRIITEVLHKNGLSSYGTQTLGDIHIFSKRYFMPLDYETYFEIYCKPFRFKKPVLIENHIFPESYTIHHFMASWVKERSYLSMLYVFSANLKKKSRAYTEILKFTKAFFNREL